jgi:hypothetical protein
MSPLRPATSRPRDPQRPDTIVAGLTLDVDHSGDVARGWLEAGEAVMAVLTGSGASMFATDRRLVIVRNGAEFRPRTGVRSWAYNRIIQVSLSPPKRGQALILVRAGRLPWQAVSMFFDSGYWSDAQRVVDEIRNHL